MLLDTHVLLWWLSDDDRLGERAREIISDARNQVYISAASTWEISIKMALGKLKAPKDMSTIIDNEGFIALPISLYHGDQTGQLQELHKDPFDRMLIAQAQAEGLILLTNDQAIVQYPVRTILAGN
ncbi:type II toxin-antitoxin system VapC family toxin [Spongiibacter pelagi]|uniref:type II toxin-antitoxin system VapC family toxin n=1 Tax=Spongiibacter pelagi TaxID=2760804 RepID=UPI00295C00CF|nr:type II toxin-antitoxin system VapC family toxin [Spongiibacter pelagi]